MKPTTRRTLYAVLTVFSLVFAAFIFFNGKNKSTLPELKDRSGRVLGRVGFEVRGAVLKPTDRATRPRG